MHVPIQRQAGNHILHIVHQCSYKISQDHTPGVLTNTVESVAHSQQIAVTVGQKRQNLEHHTVVLLVLAGFYSRSRLCQAVITICIYGL